MNIRYFSGVVLCWVLLAFTFTVAKAQIEGKHYEFSDLPRVHALAMNGTPIYSTDYTNFGYANPNAQKGGMLIQGMTGTFDSVNPFLITGEPATNLMATYDPLMARSWDEPFTLYGLIAKEVAVPEDRSSITFFLDERAKFQDGHPITAEDVVYSYEMQKQHGRPNSRRIYKLAEKVETPDNHTVYFKFGDGYDRETALIFGLMRIFPKHYWTTGGREFTKPTLTPPVGSGPYRIKSLEQGRYIEYERVPDYWATDLPPQKGQNNFDILRYDYYRDETIARQAFESGEFDLWREWSAHKWKIDYDFDALKAKNIVGEAFKHGRPDRARFMIFNTRRSLFSDIRVRKALTYAFDFEWLNKNLFHNAYLRTDSTFPNSELSAHAFEPPKTDGSGRKGVRQNLKTAMNLLQASGWQVVEGMLVHSESGEPFKFEILLGDPWQEKLVMPFIENLKILGINATVRTVDSAQYAGRLQAFDYDMTANHWTNSLSPGTEQAVYWGSLAAKTEGTKNYAGVSSPEIDGLIDDITKATTREAMVDAIHKLDEKIMNGYYGIPLYYSDSDYIAHQSTIVHPEKTPLYGPVLETWWSGE